MEVHMVADMEVDKVTDKVADMEVDKAADMTADIQNEVYEAWNVRKQSVLGRSCLMQNVPCLLREAIVILRAMASLTFASLFYQHKNKWLNIVNSEHFLWKIFENPEEWVCSSWGLRAGDD